LAEQIIYEEAINDNMPMVIFRPSIGNHNIINLSKGTHNYYITIKTKDT